jgi:hypothetical protein
VQTLKQVPRPDWRKILLFAIFVAIAIGGKIQAWAFTDVPPKPPLYDLLRPFPIWPIWMFLLMPLALLALPLRLLGLDVIGGPSWLFIVANITYFYLLSCLMVTGFRWIKARWRSHCLNNGRRDVTE